MMKRGELCEKKKKKLCFSHILLLLLRKTHGAIITISSLETLLRVRVG
ncbi:BnaC05g17490D [Brassica napus]|uniref:BnaC05g17490D protein n=1 Tax=Brassica napus TaxID=3708 RepID=A0A078HK40_BRANA|nr:BnaC05g17490D [Brassica napus]